MSDVIIIILLLYNQYYDICPAFQLAIYTAKLNFFFFFSLSLCSYKIDGLEQDCGNSIASAMELPQSSSKPLI